MSSFSSVGSGAVISKSCRSSRQRLDESDQRLEDSGVVPMNRESTMGPVFARAPSALRGGVTSWMIFPSRAVLPLPDGPCTTNGWFVSLWR